MSKRDEASSLSILEVQECPECKSRRLMRDYDSAEIVCMDCGFVIKMRMADRGPEWRAFNNEQKEKRARTGAPVTYTIHDKGLSTVIDRHDRDAYGRKFSIEKRAQIYRLRKWQRRIRVSDAMERNLAFALSEITKIANNLSLPRNIVETASVIYRKAIKKNLIRGRSIRGICAASAYIACRQHGLARTLDEIAKASNMSKREVGRCYRFLVKELDCFIPPVKASRYISRFSNHLMVRGRAEKIANKILSTARKLKLTSGRGPRGIAAAAIYIASILVGEKMTQREIAETANITEVTIRNRYREIVERLLFIMNL